MNVLITNDDGIAAPGLAALERAVSGTIYVVAPAEAVSECGHSVETREAIRFERRGERRVAVWGKPADCVRLALHVIFPEVHFHRVYSGVNAGGNLGVDRHISGTLAAAREAAIHGRVAVAFSQYMRRGVAVDWDWTSRAARRVVDELESELGADSDGALFSVNFPSLEAPGLEFPRIRWCEPSKRPLPIAFDVGSDGARYSGVYSQRGREPGSDIDVCFGGGISVSRLDW